jgi:hypothetical protein
MTSVSVRPILLEGFDSPLNEFKHAAKNEGKQGEEHEEIIVEGTALVPPQGSRPAGQTN